MLATSVPGLSQADQRVVRNVDKSECREGNPMELKDATALITGASSGIGASLAELLVAKGCRVIATARRLDRLQALAARLGPRCLALQLDQNDPASAASIVARLPAEWRRIDILVNNAAHDIGGKLPFAEAAVEDHVAIIDTNISGLIRVTRAILPDMLKRAAGHVVNIGSGAGVTPVLNDAAYVASKFAVNGFTQALWLECKGKVKVTQVLPGVVHTEFDEVRRRGDAAKAAAFYAGFPTCLLPEDVAACVVYALEQPAHVNIAEMRVVPAA
jgi:NADP-dependent 3-hydroxy acid dehydrogenase YdfG